MRLIVISVAEGLYDLVLQVGHFSANAVRIAKRANLQQVEKLLFDLENADAIEINGEQFPLDGATIAVITAESNIANLNFGGSLN